MSVVNVLAIESAFDVVESDEGEQASIHPDMPSRGLRTDPVFPLSAEARCSN